MPFTFHTTPGGGWKATGTTPLGTFSVEWDADGKLIAQELQPTSRGLGDTVRKVTAALGLPHCPSCRQRQAWLNRVVKYNAPRSAAQSPSDTPPRTEP